jgi:hypothetical protein
MTPHRLPALRNPTQHQIWLNASRAEIKFIEPMKRLSTVFVKTSALHQHRLFDSLECVLKRGGKTK